MKKNVWRQFSFFLAAWMVFFSVESVLWCAPKELFDPQQASVAVISYPSSEKDRVWVEETADSIRTRLQQIPYFHVVDKAQVQALVNYHADYVSDNSHLTSAERYLGLAKTHWFDRQYHEAEVTVNSAIASLRANREDGALLIDALLTKVMILKEEKRYDESKAVFEEVLKINPHLSMEGLPINGRSLGVFKKTRAELLERHAGSLDIKTDPPAETIYLNGIKKGVSPLVLKDLPEASYLVTIEGSHYQTTSFPVTVTANTTQFINKKLNWVEGAKRSVKDLGVPVKTDEVIESEIKMATKIGETLKVDKVVLVSSETKNGQPVVVARTIDTLLKAAYNPVAVPLSDYLKNKKASVAQMADTLDNQARKNVLNNPAEFIQPKTGDIRVMRRKRPFTQTPAFYTVVGLIVGGAIGATAALLLDDNGGSSGSSSSGGDAGGVGIQFQ